MSYLELLHLKHIFKVLVAFGRFSQRIKNYDVVGVDCNCHKNLVEIVYIFLKIRTKQN
jgi:hypothetical protein